MNLEEFREYCLSKKRVTEDFPFDEVTMCFKVMGKIFAITPLDEEDFKVNLKYLPEEIEELRAQYPDVLPGWHMNKKHWNTVLFDGDMSDDELVSLIDISYDLVVKKLPKKVREELVNK
jgi:predicted DNA-binding protein (MmcQ/YjbR family)